eukprot:s7395_g4.t1
MLWPIWKQKLVVGAMSAVLLLGGEEERDRFAVTLAYREGRETPLMVFASSPAAGAEERLAKLQEAGQLVLSYRAVDTVTNFSTMIPDLQGAGVTHVLLVTSSYHMPRAAAIAEIMLGSSGITFETWTVDCATSRAGKHEPRWKIYRDVLRARIWSVTGWDFLWLARMLISCVRCLRL